MRLYTLNLAPGPIKADIDKFDDKKGFGKVFDPPSRIIVIHGGEKRLLCASSKKILSRNVIDYNTKRGIPNFGTISLSKFWPVWGSKRWIVQILFSCIRALEYSRIVLWRGCVYVRSWETLLFGSFGKYNGGLVWFYGEKKYIMGFFPFFWFLSCCSALIYSMIYCK